MQATEFILGIDVGGTKTAVVLGDCRGQIFERVELATQPQRGFEATFAEIVSAVQTIRARGAEQGRPPRCVSVSIGGPLDIGRGIIYSPPNLPGWDDVPLKQLLAEQSGLDVYIEHDGNAGALAEWYFGAARGARNVVFLTLGSGLGAGMILDGRLYRGCCDLAGEVGHVRVAETGPAAYGKAGSWEGCCSGTGIARLATLRYPQRWQADGISARELGELARAGDADAQAVLAEAGRYLGRGLAILLDLLNPEIVVLGALAVRLGDFLSQPAREELQREALPAALAACRIVPAELGAQLGDVAALCAAIEAGGRQNCG